MGKIYASLETATPANPAAGKSVIYPKAGGWFYRNETGAEVQWLDTTSLPSVANTYLRRNAGNTAFDAKTPQQVADELAPLQKFGPRNYIIGGDFSTNPWQPGTSFAGLVSGQGVADCFNFGAQSSGTWTVAKIADAPTFAQAGRHITHCIEMLCTAADATVNAGDYVLLEHPIEGYNYLPLYRKAQLVGFWAKANVVGAYGVSMRGAADSVSFVGNVTINAANTWEYKTLPVPTEPVGGTWNFSNGTGAKMTVAFVSGTTFQTSTLNAWQSGNFIASTSQVNLGAAVNNYIRIADVKLIEGLVDVAPYQATEEEVLAACQRYYRIIRASARHYAAAAGAFHDNTLLFGDMRSLPTATTGTAGGLGNVSAAFIGVHSANSARVEITATAAGDSYVLDWPVTLSARL